MNFDCDNLFGCDSFISSATGRQRIAMAREAWPNAINARLVKSQVGVYFRGNILNYLPILDTILAME